MSVSNTIIRNMLGAGIGTSPAAGAANLKIVISNVRVFNCANGGAFSTNNKVTIYDSVFSGNSGAGVFAEDNDGGGQTEVAVDHCVVTDNGTGFQSSLNSTIRVLGKEVKVPITYAKEGVYYVFTAPSYKVTVARGTRTVAWKEFSDKLALAVEERLKARL